MLHVAVTTTIAISVVMSHHLLHTSESVSVSKKNFSLHTKIGDMRCDSFSNIMF